MTANGFRKKENSNNCFVLFFFVYYYFFVIIIVFTVIIKVSKILNELMVVGNKEINIKNKR